CVDPSPGRARPPGGGSPGGSHPRGPHRGGFAWSWGVSGASSWFGESLCAARGQGAGGHTSLSDTARERSIRAGSTLVGRSVTNGTACRCLVSKARKAWKSGLDLCGSTAREGVFPSGTLLPEPLAVQWKPYFCVITF